MERILRSLPAAVTVNTYLHSCQLTCHPARPQKSQDLPPLVLTQVKPEKVMMSILLNVSEKIKAPKRKRKRRDGGGQLLPLALSGLLSLGAARWRFTKHHPQDNRKIT